MKPATLTLFAVAAAAALLFTLPPYFAAQAKKSLAEQLELLDLALLLDQHQHTLSAQELERLRQAIPSVKEDNPKLYKDPEKTERILLIYMILDEIERASSKDKQLSSLVGKSPGQLAHAFVERVYNAK